MGYQNYKGDFIRSETFFRKEEDGSTVQIPVPEHVRIEYFTKGNCSRFVAERNGDEYRNCSLSEDGLSLAVNVALSRTPIGQGEMYAIVTEFITDYNFPGGERQNPAPYKTDVILYCGPSDLSLESTGISILASLTYGYSAYDLAVKHGYEGTEEEWVDHLNLPLQTGSGSNSIMHINAAEASGSNSFAEGTGTTAAGSGSHAEGKESQTGVAAHHAHSEGLRAQANQQQAHAEGSDTIASGAQAHAEGSGTQASGTRSHAEGSGTHAAGSSSHAEGHECVAEGAQSHAEGYRSKAVVTIAHAEGSETEATGGSSHAEGSKSIAAGAGSHAEGVSTSAAGYSSHAEGQFTRTKNRAEHAEGYYNLSVQGKTVHSVGIGNGDSEDPAQGKHRRNAEEIHTDGRKFLLGVGGYDGTNSETAKAVQEVLANLVDLDSEQTISGAKTFITALIAKAGLNMVNTRIRKVGTPKDADDAATKAYVDALIQRLEAAEAKITTLQNKLNEITTEE